MSNQIIFTKTRVDELNRKAANRCPEHVRRMPACPICARISEDLKAAMVGLGMLTPIIATPGKRVLQSDKPLMNKLEAEWFEIINAQYPNFPRPRAQAKRYRLGNGVSFTPDFTASSWPNPYGGPAREIAWEVKGDMAWDDAIVKIKLAPTIWPEMIWLFCWKENGEWKTQRMLP